jgi:type I restriction enzyme, S subunit
LIIFFLLFENENIDLKLSNSNSIVFPKRGAAIYTNKVRLLSKKSIVDPNVMVLTCKKLLDPIYFYYCLKYIGLYNLVENAGIPQLNNKDLYPKKFITPPPDEQKKIGEILTTLDLLIEKTLELGGIISKSKDKKEVQNYEKLKKGLMQKLLTGQIRVKI